MYGLDFRKNGQKVDVYGYLQNLATGTDVTIGTVDKYFPVNTYAIFPLYSSAPPYSTIGSVWIDHNGRISLYKPSATDKGYVSGSYICKD